MTSPNGENPVSWCCSGAVLVLFWHCPNIGLGQRGHQQGIAP
ncbi:hypothetical protein [Oculatella sp. LEGE 06141]|nr:hypothetical protein [Oculatella sp. LEGE 06141]